MLMEASFCLVWRNLLAEARVMAAFLFAQGNPAQQSLSYVKAVTDLEGNYLGLDCTGVGKCYLT